MKRLPVMLAALLVLGISTQVLATGLLIPTDRSLQPLAIKYHRARVKIKDRVAVTHVDQVFVNNTNRDLEATYIFPLPKGATVSDFYLYVNGKKTKGEILEKNRARNIYEGIVRRMRDPGLIEYLGRDLFKCRVYPVPKRGEQRIEIEFTQVMPFEGGLMKYTYPMRTDRASARTMRDFTMSIDIASKVPIKSIYSPSHEIYQRKKDDHHAVAGFEKNAALLDRDFELIITMSEKDIGLNLLTHRDPGEPGFFMVMASPKSQWRDTEILGKNITFVIDTSGSMSGKKMQYAKKALRYCLKQLSSDDLFNVIRFSTDVEAFKKHPVAASKANIQKALNFTNRMEAAGGTAIDEALTLALRGYKNEKMPNMVVFLTDGHPTVGETVPKKIIKHTKKANKAKVRLFVFGVGEEINTHLLDSISGQNQGSSTYVKPGQQIERDLSAFYDKVSHPVLTNLALDFGKIHEYDVVPKRLPDMFKGSQLILLGRYRNDGHTALTLTGTAGNSRKKFVFDGKFPKKNASNDFIPRLWATRKIGFLLDQIRLGGEQRELVNEVIRLSKRYGIVTPYTSYLVTEDQPHLATPRPMPRRRPPVIRRPWAANKAAMEEAEATADSTATPVLGGAQAQSAPMMERRRSARKAKAFASGRAGFTKAESGRMAVDMAVAVKEMKKADRTGADDDEISGIRYVAGRAFRFQDGAWTDMKFDRSKMKVLKIKYMGKAHFWLMNHSALLKKFFSLGDRVIVVVGKDKAIEIGPSGGDDVSSAELKRFVP